MTNIFTTLIFTFVLFATSCTPTAPAIAQPSTQCFTIEQAAAQAKTYGMTFTDINSYSGEQGSKLAEVIFDHFLGQPGDLSVEEAEVDGITVATTAFEVYYAFTDGNCIRVWRKDTLDHWIEIKTKAFGRGV